MIVRNLGDPYRDATGQLRDMLVPGRDPAVFFDFQHVHGRVPGYARGLAGFGAGDGEGPSLGEVVNLPHPVHELPRGPHLGNAVQQRFA